MEEKEEEEEEEEKLERERTMEVQSNDDDYEGGKQGFKRISCWKMKIIH